MQDYATTQIGALVAKAEDPGVGVVLLFLAVRGGGVCGRWWARRAGPRLWTRSSRGCKTPADDWWQHHRPFPQQRPAEATDLDRLRHLLVARPFRLSYEAADSVSTPASASSASTGSRVRDSFAPAAASPTSAASARDMPSRWRPAEWPATLATGWALSLTRLFDSE